MIHYKRSEIMIDFSKIKFAENGHPHNTKGNTYIMQESIKQFAISLIYQIQVEHITIKNFAMGPWRVRFTPCLTQEQSEQFAELIQDCLLADISTEEGAGKLLYGITRTGWPFLLTFRYIKADSLLTNLKNAYFIHRLNRILKRPRVNFDVFSVYVKHMRPCDRIKIEDIAEEYSKKYPKEKDITKAVAYLAADCFKYAKEQNLDLKIKPRFCKKLSIRDNIGNFRGVREINRKIKQLFD